MGRLKTRWGAWAALVVALPLIGCSSKTRPEPSAPSESKSAPAAPSTAPPETSHPKPSQGARAPASSERPPARSAEQTAAEDIPVFEWPPPRASAAVTLPDRFFARVTTFGDIDRLLSRALAPAGYVETSYFAIPSRSARSGFALVTRLEQIDDDGSPVSGGGRWSVVPQEMTGFSLAAYLRALLHAPNGHYRVIVFAVTHDPFSMSGRRVSGAESAAWLATGLNRLPTLIAGASAEGAAVTALIYEFTRNESGQSLMLPSRLAALAHLEKSEIWSHFDDR